MTRSANVIVVGTSHSIQMADFELKPFLENLCRQFKARAVAEEMNEEALSENMCAASIPMRVATALHITHQFCDPNRAERAKLEIRQENDIRIQAFPRILPESEVATRLEESHAKRERYWLERLRFLNTWPVLFICGADHVGSFCHLLEREGIVAHVAAEDWSSK